MHDKKYVLGFVFDYQKNYVVVIKKNRPDWQKGKFNGIGGKMNIGENPERAMIREFEEETGCFIPSSQWTQTIKLCKKGEYEVYIFTAYLEAPFDEVETTTDEKVQVFPVKQILLGGRIDFIPNLQWIIPLCLAEDVDFPVMVENK